MARGINKVILVGRLGADPDCRYMASGRAVVNISVATNRAWKDRDGNAQEQTEWHKVVLFDKLGEIAGEYLRKGNEVYIEGRLQTRKWQDQNGQDRWTTEIVASDMQMLGSRGDDAPARSSSQGGFRENAAPAKQGAARPAEQSPVFEGEDNFTDDDIPF